MPALPKTAGIALLGVLLTGCGIRDPYTNTTTPTAARGIPPATSTVTNADPAPERGGTIPQAARAAQSQLAASAGAPTPRAALERYASRYVNWTAQTVTGVQGQLAAISLGQARAQALQAAASYARDGALNASRVANHGSVISIARGYGTAATWWVIVTQEQTTGTADYAGLPATDHVTYAQLQHTGSGWIVSQWSPQN
jgi:hypothetical protein